MCYQEYLDYVDIELTLNNMKKHLLNQFNLLPNHTEMLERCKKIYIDCNVLLHIFKTEYNSINIYNRKDLEKFLNRVDNEAINYKFEKQIEFSTKEKYLEYD
jgi:hypothetical protein